LGRKVKILIGVVETGSRRGLIRITIGVGHS
jgi:hypothetical protein